MTLVDLIPPALVKVFARPYVAGDSLAAALDVADDLLARRSLLTTLDLLAEGLDTEDEVEGIVRAYERMIDDLAARASLTGASIGGPTFSLKPSSFTIAALEKGNGHDAHGARERILALSERARRAGLRYTIDMESRHWTDWTLQLARELRGMGHDHAGIVLQSRLHRTAADIERLPSGLRVRLVIGIYQEPADVATTDKREMKERLLTHAAQLLARGHYLEFATHDETYVRRFLGEVVPKARATADQFEVQMLYGVPRERLLAELRTGKVGGVGPVRARLYVPYALSWAKAIAYLRRRLREYPKMAWLVGKDLLKRPFVR